jgi:hypothetical protein
MRAQATMPSVGVARDGDALSFSRYGAAILSSLAGRPFSWLFAIPARSIPTLYPGQANDAIQDES